MPLIPSSTPGKSSHSGFGTSLFNLALKASAKLRYRFVMSLGKNSFCRRCRWSRAALFNRRFWPADCWMTCPAWLLPLSGRVFIQNWKVWIRVCMGIKRWRGGVNKLRTFLKKIFLYTFWLIIRNLGQNNCAFWPGVCNFVCNLYQMTESENCALLVKNNFAHLFIDLQ